MEGNSQHNKYEVTCQKSILRTEVDLDSLDDVLPHAPAKPKSEGVWRLVRSDVRDKKTNQLFTTMTWVVSY